MAFRSVFLLALRCVQADESCLQEETTLLQIGGTAAMMARSGKSIAKHIDEPILTNENAPVLPPTGEAQYLGCFVDDPARDLGAVEAGGWSYTYATCLDRCEGHLFMSLQNGGECFCADAYGTATQYSKVSDSQCNRIREPCSSESRWRTTADHAYHCSPCSSESHNCGGFWHNAIYAIGNLGNEDPHFYGQTADGCPMGNSNGADLSDATHEWADHQAASDFSGEMIATEAHRHPDATASVRCCSMDGSSCSTDSLAGGCQAGKTLAEAHEICGANDMRLCTEHEMADNVCCGTGCWFNHHAVWVTPHFYGLTADGCPRDASEFSGEMIATEAHSHSGTTASVRCCSMDGSSCSTGSLAGGCQAGKTLAEAHEICAANDMRLCTEHEMADNVCCGTGCWFNNHAVWVVPKFNLVQFGKKCPHQHEDRLFRDPASGSSDITLEQCHAECLARAGCAHFSHGEYRGGHVCMGCTTLVNAESHAGFDVYDMAYDVYQHAR